MRLSLTCPDISCCGCAASIKKAAEGLAGVTHLDVNVASKTVTAEVEIDEARQALVDLLDDIGFPVEGEPAVHR